MVAGVQSGGKTKKFYLKMVGLIAESSAEFAWTVSTKEDENANASICMKFLESRDAISLPQRLLCCEKWMKSIVSKSTSFPTNRDSVTFSRANNKSPSLSEIGSEKQKLKSSNFQN